MTGILDNPDEGARLLIELMKTGGQLRQQIESRQIDFARLSPEQEAGLRDKLKEWLKKALELAEEFSPESYSISLSALFVGSIGFSWTLQRE